MDDQASQTRKTQQQVSQLTESIAALVEVQRRRTRGINLNSFVAYAIFTLLCGGGFYLLYRSRANELTEAREHAQQERDAAVRRADELAGKVTARDQADQRAFEVYQLLEAGRRGEALTRLPALVDLPLSRTERAVTTARARESQVMEVDGALKAAAAAVKAGRYGEVVGPLEAALLAEPTGSRAAAMHYFLGVAYAKLGTLDKATTHLQTAVTAEVEHDDARFQLASALDRSGAYAKARGEYDRFATAHPQSPLAAFAMRRSATLARMPATAPVTPAAGSAAKPAALPAKPTAPPAKLPAAVPPAKPAAPPAKPPAAVSPVTPPAPAPVDPAAGPGAGPPAGSATP